MHYRNNASNERYPHHVPPAYPYSAYQDEWDAIPREDIENAAAYVRNSFRRCREGMEAVR